MTEHLAKDPTLRRQWGFEKRKRYPLGLIAERAFPESTAEGRRIIENAIQSRTRLRNAHGDENESFRLSDADAQAVQPMLHYHPFPWVPIIAADSDGLGQVVQNGDGPEDAYSDTA